MDTNQRRSLLVTNVSLYGDRGVLAKVSISIPGLVPSVIGPGLD